MPQLGANDTVATIVEWKVQPGQHIEKGHTLAVVETSKATFDVECEEDGFFYPLTETGVELPVQQTIGLILAEQDESFFQQKKQELAGTQQAGEEQPQLAGLNVTAGARRLLEEYRIDVSLLPKDRIVRADDVQALLGQSPLADFQTDSLRRCVVYGASQGGRSVVECLKAMGGYEVVAFLDDDPNRKGTTYYGLPVWPADELENLHRKDIGALATHIAVRELRLKIRDRSKAAGVYMLNVIHPSAVVADSVRMGVGNIIKAGAVLDTDVRLGDCCIIDNGVIIPHHNRIGNACHLAPGVRMGGDCDIHDCTLVGIGATISARIQIGSNVVVAPGACVVRNVPSDVVVEGVPARIVGKRR